MDSSQPKKGQEGFLQCSHPNCKFRTRWEFNLARHARVHDPKLVQYFQCPACRKTFGFKCNLLRHLEGVHPGFNFSPSLLLPQSASSSTDLQSLTNEPKPKTKKGKGTKKRFNCLECDFESALEVDLKEHVDTSHHHDHHHHHEQQQQQQQIKFYDCSLPNCNFQSKWSQNVKEHEKRLHGSKVNLQQQNINGAAKGGDGKRDATGQKFKCSQCGTHFASRCNLSRHLRTSVCLQNLKKWKSSVQENMSSSKEPEKNDWEECHFCKYVQRLGTYLQKHMRTCPGCHRTLTPIPYNSTTRIS